MDESRAPLTLLLTSYLKACNRFLTGGDRPRVLIPQLIRHVQDPEQHDPGQDRVTYADLYTVLGEALRCARVLDLRISKAADDPHWWQRVESGELVPGVRYARNAVEHDGAELIAFRDGEPRNTGRRIVYETTWRDVDASRGTGATAYRAHLVDEPILTTLFALAPAFAAAIVDLERGVWPSRKP